MIAEMISYRVAFPAFSDFVEQSAGEMFDLMKMHVPVRGAFTPGSAALNRLVLLAFHEDYGARDEAWASLAADTGWREFLRGAGAVLEEAESTVLNNAIFSPLRSLFDVDAVIAKRGGARPMLFEMRTYTAKPGRMATVLKTLDEEGNPLIHQFVEWPVAYFTAETGLANRVMMLWAYSSATERATRKSRMLPDPRFQELGSRFNPNFAAQRSDFLIPTAFSPLH
jgi:NIPSNAP